MLDVDFVLETREGGVWIEDDVGGRKEDAVRGAGVAYDETAATAVVLEERKGGGEVSWGGKREREKTRNELFEGRR